MIESQGTTNEGESRTVIAFQGLDISLDLYGVKEINLGAWNNLVFVFLGSNDVDNWTTNDQLQDRIRSTSYSRISRAMVSQFETKKS
ncbi:MAG: hypothetical protein ACFFED_00985 [Candidatus Thorarchaeota archaeon]